MEYTLLYSMLKSKIHRATLTGKSLDYEGSITIDSQLMDAAGLMPNEHVHVLNMNSGSRLETYVIKGKAGTGVIELNGPAARLGEKGDKVVIVSYAYFTEEEVKKHKPKVILVDAKNKPAGKTK